MTKHEKMLARMLNNPQGWTIENLKAIASRHGIEWRQKNTSHVTFRRPDGKIIPIPVHGEIKPIYIKGFLNFLED
ncbi:MAG: type II toxin-antitoxin system HicA family toxin [Magnetococcales bacterium]|nr:type II toxin-antitoxin system HicA family toxin [Magnetococcales bacterium]